ncbi:N-acetyltransferase family protein [Streptomyces sp. bgisy027]|uniref:GNAT family N-acetyltransferase n=1 Tax=Streptomyces sp. bgisy027 TaxID=3413770 RepID=UPI003D752370
MIEKTDVRIERLDHRRMAAFISFADRATLDSLAHIRAIRRPAFGQTYLCALYRDQVIGCTSWHERHRHEYVSLEGRKTHTTSVYLCSSEILPEFRGKGIGGMLYAHRLAACGRDAAAVSVEILGQGTPLSVDADARPGLVWHLAHGFVIIGHSCAADAGPVLARYSATPSFTSD